MDKITFGVFRHAEYDLEENGDLTLIGKRSSFQRGEELKPATEGKDISILIANIKRCVQTAEYILEGLKDSGIIIETEFLREKSDIVKTISFINSLTLSRFNLIISQGPLLPGLLKSLGYRGPEKRGSYGFLEGQIFETTKSVLEIHEKILKKGESDEINKIEEAIMYELAYGDKNLEQLTEWFGGDPLYFIKTLLKNGFLKEIEKGIFRINL